MFADLVFCVYSLGETLPFGELAAVLIPFFNGGALNGWQK